MCNPIINELIVESYLDRLVGKAITQPQVIVTFWPAISGILTCGFGSVVADDSQSMRAIQL